MLKKHLGICIFVVLMHVFFCQADINADINIVGPINEINSLSRHTYAFLDCLQKNMPVNLIATDETQNAINLNNPQHLENLVNSKFTLTGITFFTGMLHVKWQEYLNIPNASIINAAYSVTERSEIHPEWIEKFNKYFDAVIVADEWLVNVYKSCGVTKPIFVLPLTVNIENLLNKQPKKSPSKIFTFGCSAGFWDRKNHKRLIQAFVLAFKNNPNVRLKIHGRYGENFNKIARLIVQLKATNILLMKKMFTRKEYEDFIGALDCYILISKGEGFSITPREALAAGIPCILSNNTAHKTICNTSYVSSVPAEIKERSYTILDKLKLGYDFNCKINDIQNALQKVYKNYEYNLELAIKGREWVKQYLPENVQHRYMNFAKPKLVILGPDNLITDEYLMTNSETLYKKYQQLCKNSETIFKKILTNP